MLKIAICDDDTKELKHTFQLAQKHFQARPDFHIAIRCFQSGYELLEEVDNHGRFDIYLLDILMPHVNGIELGEELRRQDRAALIIYLTNSPDFALDSYHVRAQGYLLVNTKNGAESISFTQLMYVEYWNHRLVCHLFNGETVESNWYRKPFGYAAEILTGDSRFVKISASHVINMQHVKAVTPQGFLMSGGVQLPVTRTYAAAKQKYMDFILERGWQV